MMGGARGGDERADPPGDRRKRAGRLGPLLPQAVARGRLRTRRTVEAKPALQIGVLCPQGGVLALKPGHPTLKRLDPALKFFDEAANFGRKLHARLESQPAPAHSLKPISSPISPPTVTFRIHPSLAVTNRRFGSLKSQKLHEFPQSDGLGAAPRNCRKGLPKSPNSGNVALRTTARRCGLCHSGSNVYERRLRGCYGTGSAFQLGA